MKVFNPTTRPDREAYFIRMYQEILNLATPKGGTIEKVTPLTKVKGTTILKATEYAAGGYHRLKKWMEEELQRLEALPRSVPVEATPVQVPELSRDMMQARDHFHKCFELMKSRNTKYGDSWKVLTIPSLANLCEMKLHRIANMQADKLDPKIEDELMDTVNYCIFGLIKLNEEKQ